MHLLYPEDGRQPGAETLGGAEGCQPLSPSRPPATPALPFPLLASLLPDSNLVTTSRLRLPFSQLPQPPWKPAHPREGQGELPSLGEEEGPRPHGVTCGLLGSDCRSPQTPKGSGPREKVLQLCGPGWGWGGVRVRGRDLRPAASAMWRVCNVAAKSRGGGHAAHGAATYLPCAQSCLTLWDPKDGSPLGSSVHGIFQARILERVAISFSRGSSQPTERTCIFCGSCIGRQVLYH